MKTCSRCHKLQPVENFGKYYRSADGLQFYCRTCKREYAQQEGYESSVWRQRRYDQSAHGRRQKRTYQTSNNGRLRHQHKERRRRERLHNHQTTMTVDDIAAVRRRFQNRCFVCGAVDRLEIDHHYPLSLGHALSFNNAVLLCKSCNSSKNDRLPEDFYTKEQIERLQCLLAISP